MPCRTPQDRQLRELLALALSLVNPARHARDFASVNWYGAYYTFTAAQARVVAELWAAWENGTPDVRQETLLEAAGSESRKLAYLFRDHPAWGVLIVPGPVRGLYRLGPPPEKPTPGATVAQPAARQNAGHERTNSA